MSVLIGRAFERLFCPKGREFKQANLQKFKCPGGCPGVMLKFRIDQRIRRNGRRKSTEGLLNTLVLYEMKKSHLFSQNQIISCSKLCSYYPCIEHLV